MERKAATDPSASSGSRVGELLKQAAALGGVCYACGFVILNAALGRLGVHTFSLASARVFAAGLLYLLLGLLSGVGWLAVLLVSLQLRPVTEWSKRWLYLTLVLGWAAGTVFGFLFYWGLWSGLYGRALSGILPELIWWTLFTAAALVLLAAGGLYSVAGRGGLLWPALGLVCLVVSLQRFGAELYSTIPGGFGGGKPLRVQLLVKPDSAAFLARYGLSARALTRPGVKPGEAWSLTAPVDLIDSGADGYILRTLGQPPRTLVLAKDNVQGVAHNP